ncbi:MAG: MarR family transcriptional regulator [Bacilli bacterium]|nr:MarR family transcriptional regulator [Bacilli bacterium]
MNDFKISDYFHRLKKQTFWIINTSLMKYGITPQQGRLIRFLALRNEDTTFQKDIEEFLSTRKSSVSSILKNLEKLKLIERKSYPNDGRFKEIRLTEKGLAVHKESLKISLDIEARIQNALTEDETKTLGAILKKIVEEFEN